MNHIVPIAHIENEFKSKFGIPCQSNLVKRLESRIIFETEYRNVEALRGLESYSHIWLIWGFSESKLDTWTPTVRPPRLGGNVRMGVFATRSPFRPNSIGLSSVEIDKIDFDASNGPIIHVRGADLMNNTPIYDIKPYIPYTDSHPDAKAGFTDSVARKTLNVEFAEDAQRSEFEAAFMDILKEILANDPRPSYHDDPNRIYGMAYGDVEIKFSVAGDTLTVHEIAAKS